MKFCWMFLTKKEFNLGLKIVWISSTSEFTMFIKATYALLYSENNFSFGNLHVLGLHM